MALAPYSLLVIALCLLALSGTGSAQAEPNRSRAVVAAAPSTPARDGISGNSVARAGAHGILGGPAVGKPVAISSVNRKQHR